MADAHLKAMELSAGTIALQQWVQEQAANNPALDMFERMAIKRIPLEMYGQIVTVVCNAIDDLRDKIANPTQENAST